MSTRRRPRIAVVGAGVIGLSTAVCLAETFGQQLDVIVIANQFSPNITSDQAGAIFTIGVIYSQESSQRYEEFEAKHAPATFRHLNFVHETYGAEVTGVHFLPMYFSYEKGTSVPAIPIKQEVFPDYTIYRSDAHKILSLPSQSTEDLVAVESFKTFLVNPTKYLAWLTDQFRSKGGLIVHHEIGSFQELENYDLIMNCTGLGARHLVGDSSVYPVRGQVVIVRAPQVKECYFKVGPTSKQYIFPQGDGTVLLGGTTDEYEWSTTINPNTERDIIERCAAIHPALKDAEVVGGWVGLRPARDPIRLEVEGHSVGPAVVHNYGHGGNGFVLGWGSATEACKLARQCLLVQGFSLSPPSKL